jgi:hypothetical protein
MPPALLGPIPKFAWPEGGPYGGRSPPPSWDRRRRPAPWAGGHRTRTARSRTGASSERHHGPEPGQLAVDVGQHQLVALDAVPDPALLDQQRSHACPCPDLRAGLTAATTAPSSSSLTAPRRRRGPARRSPRPRHTDARSCDPPPPAHPPCAAPARPASSAASRISITATSRNATRLLQIARPERIGSGRAAAPRRTTRRWSHDWQPGWSHEGGKKRLRPVP